VGVSWTPHLDSSGEDIGQTNGGSIDDYIESGAAYRGSSESIDVLASITADWGHFNQDGPGSDQIYKVYTGAAVSFFGSTNVPGFAIRLAGGAGYQKGARPIALTAGPNVPGGDPTIGTRGLVNATDTGAYGGTVGFVRDASYSWYNVGAGLTLGPANMSFNWGQVIDTDTEEGFQGSRPPKPYAAILGLSFVVDPGLVVGGELQYFENGDGNRSNDGVLGLAGIRIAF
jgi:hypothetical protein